MSVLIYKDDSNTTINGLIEKIKEKIGKSGTVKETYTTSNVIKQISPTLLINSNKMVIPKFKLDEKGIEDIDLKIISNKDNITTLKTIDDEIEIPIQVNGKLRGTFETNHNAGEEKLKKLAVANETVSKHIEGKEIVKIIVIKNKIVNIVVKN